MMNTTASKHSDLKHLSPEDIRKAFDKVCSTTNFRDVRLVLITSEYYTKALELLKDHFVHDEPMATAFDMQWGEDAEHFWTDVFSNDMSLGLLDEHTGEFIAVRGIKVVSKEDDNGGSGDQGGPVDKRIQQGLAFMNYCDDKAQFFEHFNTDVAVHFLGLCVARQHRKKGIATQLFGAALKFIQNFELPCVYVKGEGSSNFSKHIYEKFEFETLYEQSFDAYGTIQGLILKDTGEHKIYKVYGKCIQNPV